MYHSLNLKPAAMPGDIATSYKFRFEYRFLLAALGGDELAVHARDVGHLHALGALG